MKLRHYQSYVDLGALGSDVPIAVSCYIVKDYSDGTKHVDLRNVVVKKGMLFGQDIVANVTDKTIERLHSEILNEI